MTFLCNFRPVRYMVMLTKKENVRLQVKEFMSQVTVEQSQATGILNIFFCEEKQFQRD